MKRYFLYIACACLVLALNSCIKDEFTGGNIFCRDAQLNLTLSLGDETRYNTPDNGVGNGDNDNDAEDVLVKLNENCIKDIEIFLYPQGKEGEDAVFAYRMTLAKGVPDSTTVSDVTVSAGQLAKLFTNGATECSAYVVANYATGKTTADADGNYPGTSVAELKALEHTAKFHETYSVDVSEWGDLTLEDDFGNKLTSIKPQSTFVMDSDITSVKKDGNNIVNKDNNPIYLTRAASKITFRATIASQIEVEGVTWTSQLESVTVKFHNCVNTGAIDNGSDTERTFTMPTTPNYVDSNGVQMAPIDEFTGDAGEVDSPSFGDDVVGVSDWSVVDHLTPFYTYSAKWNEGAKNESYLELIVPWVVLDENDEPTRWAEYTYFVPVNMNDFKLVRNKHYRINLRVGVLGELDDLSEATYSYEVLDWVGNDINVNLSRPKYLVVEKDYVEMNNQESAVVGFAASDTVESAIVTVVKPIVTTEVPSYPEYTTADAWNALNNKDFKITTDNVNKTITLEHQLDNDRDSNYYDYVPYEIYVLVTMKVGDTTYTEEIKFVQYPAFYIIADTNDDYYFNASGQEDSSKNTYYGGVYVNGNRYRSSSDHDDYGGANYLGAATNENPNMYVINVSALDSDSGFVIGDPRKRVVDNIPTGDYCPSSAMYRTGTNNTLTYYYPTDDSASTKNMIAPKFRIASSYGVTSSGSYDNMRRRCATYQEDGFPAGRWRMPTHAEIDYIVKLSCRGLIPQLFNYAEDGTSGDYWCAHGYVLPHNAANGGYAQLVESKSSTESHAVRCVYDEWYWSDKCSKTTFTWGDKAR